MQRNNSLDFTSLEKITLTGDLAEVLHGWCETPVGSFGASTVGFFVTPLTSLIDVVVHAALFAGKALTSIVVSPYNAIARCINEKYAAPIDLETSSALVHLAKAVQSLFHAAILPFVFLLSPDRGYYMSQQTPSAQIHQIEKEIKRNQERINAWASNLKIGYESQIAELEEQIGKDSAMIETYKVEMGKAKEEYDKALAEQDVEQEKEKTALEIKIANMQKLIGTQQKKLDQARNTLEEKEEELSFLNAKITLLEKQHTKDLQELDQLGQENEKLSQAMPGEEKNVYKAKIATLKAEIAAKEQEVEKHKSDTQELEKWVKTATKELVHYTSQVAKQQAQLEEKAKEILKLSEENSELTWKVAKLASMEKMGDELKELKPKLANALEQIANAKEAYDQLEKSTSAKISYIQNNLESESQLVSQLEAQNDQLTESETNNIAKIKKMEQEVKTLQSNYADALEEHLAEIQELKSQHKEDMQALQEEGHLSIKLEEAEKKYKAYKAKISSLKSQVSLSESALSTSNQQKQSALNLIEKLKQDNEKLEQKLAELLKASTEKPEAPDSADDKIEDSKKEKKEKKPQPAFAVPIPPEFPIGKFGIPTDIPKVNEEEELIILQLGDLELEKPEVEEEKELETSEVDELFASFIGGEKATVEDEAKAAQALKDLQESLKAKKASLFDEIKGGAFNLNKSSKTVHLKGKHLSVLKEQGKNPFFLTQVFSNIQKFIESVNDSAEWGTAELSSSFIAATSNDWMLQSTIFDYKSKGTEEEKSEFLLSKLSYYEKLLEEIQKMKTEMGEKNAQLAVQSAAYHQAVAEKEAIKAAEELAVQRETLEKGISFDFQAIESQVQAMKWQLFLKTQNTSPEDFKSIYDEVLEWCKSGDLSEQEMLKKHKYVKNIVKSGDYTGKGKVF